MDITFDQFRNEWLKDITEGNPGSLQLGKRFVLKIFTQWLELGTEDEIYQCDGARDGGIDLAYYEQGESSSDEGNTWYVVQGKYGTALSGADTIAAEANKLINTIEGNNPYLSPIAEDVQKQLSVFIKTSSPKDKLCIIFATSEKLNGQEIRALENAQILAKEKFGPIASVQNITIETIYNRLSESIGDEYKIPLVSNLVASGNDLFVGSTRLTNLYSFMKEYRNATNDLELLYQKNVRRFLGTRKKVNKEIIKTIEENPEKFGIYNNGITFVVEDCIQEEIDKYTLVNPYIVNGCQTTRSIWEVLSKRLEKAGTGSNEEIEVWKNNLQKAVVVTKVVKIGSNEDVLLNNTTKFTNSQNAVSAKDFIALETNFQTWSENMLEKYNIFLEIQRGAWDSKKALMQLYPTNSKLQIKDCITAVDALKVYAAGWLSSAGVAFGKTPPFAPGGTLFKQITEQDNFGIDDLYAAYLLRKISYDHKFAKNSPIPSLGKGRYLLYTVIVELLKACMRFTSIYQNCTNEEVTQCILKLFGGNYDTESDSLYQNAEEVIEAYFNPAKEEDTIYKEQNFHGDLNAIIKADKTGKRDYSINLYTLVSLQVHFMKRTKERDAICSVL